MQMFKIHDNGGRPFTVKIDDENVNVYLCSCRDSSRILTTSYEKIFIGKDERYGEEGIGNSILIKKNSKTYIYIGSQIYSFQPNEEIIEYHSPIGPNDVPYPFCCGQKNTYLMIEDVKIDNNLREYDIEGNFKDPYTQYYGDEYNQNFKKFTKTIIYDRIM